MAGPEPGHDEGSENAPLARVSKDVLHIHLSRLAKLTVRAP